jgi:hypothetical protein
MPKFEKHERVRRDFDGREGVVREVEQNAILQDQYLVRWDDDRGGEDWEGEKDLHPA